MAKRRGTLKGKLSRAKEALLEYAYLITLGAVVAVVAGSAVYTSRMRTQFETEGGAQVQAAADAPEIALTPSPSPAARLTPLPTLAPMTVFYSGAGRVWPVSGEVVRGYTPDAPVYWEALACYKAHTGVDIAAAAGEEILCVRDGVVQEITRDALWGYTVRIAHTDGSTAAYAGVGFCALMEGQTITRGQIVGEAMAAIPCEAELGAHLHLEYTQGGEAADPTALLPQR